MTGRAYTGRVLNNEFTASEAVRAADLNRWSGQLRGRGMRQSKDLSDQKSGGKASAVGTKENRKKQRVKRAKETKSGGGDSAVGTRWGKPRGRKTKRCNNVSGEERRRGIDG